MKSLYFNVVVGLASLSAAPLAIGQETPAEIAEPFRGNWGLAALIEGQANPVPVPCAPLDIGGWYATIAFGEKIGNFVGVDYLDDNTCQTANTITTRISYTFKSISTAENEQILRTPWHEYDVTIKGEGTVTKLNALQICGHTDWEEKTYQSTDAYLQACTEENAKEYIAFYTKPDGLSHILSRFKVVGTGMSVENRDETNENDTFDYPTYLVRLP